MVPRVRANRSTAGKGVAASRLVQFQKRNMFQKVFQSARPGNFEIGFAKLKHREAGFANSSRQRLKVKNLFLGKRGDLGFGKEGLGLLPRITPLSLPKYPKPRSNLCVPSPRFECFVLVPESTPAEISFTPLFIRGYV